MDPEYRNVLIKLQRNARRRKDVTTTIALGVAIRRDELLRQLIDALREIRSLPCLGGETRFACNFPDCARCYAEKTLNEFRNNAGFIYIDTDSEE